MRKLIVVVLLVTIFMTGTGMGVLKFFGIEPKEETVVNEPPELVEIPVDPVIAEEVVLPIEEEIDECDFEGTSTHDGLLIYNSDYLIVDISILQKIDLAYDVPRRQRRDAEGNLIGIGVGFTIDYNTPILRVWGGVEEILTTAHQDWRGYKDLSQNTRVELRCGKIMFGNATIKNLLITNDYSLKIDSFLNTDDFYIDFSDWEEIENQFPNETGFLGDDTFWEEYRGEVYTTRYER